MQKKSSASGGNCHMHKAKSTWGTPRLPTAALPLYSTGALLSPRPPPDAFLAPFSFFLDPPLTTCCIRDGTTALPCNGPVQALLPGTAELTWIYSGVNLAMKIDKCSVTSWQPPCWPLWPHAGPIAMNRTNCRSMGTTSMPIISLAAGGTALVAVLRSYISHSVNALEKYKRWNSLPSALCDNYLSMSTFEERTHLFLPRNYNEHNPALRWCSPEFVAVYKCL